MRAKVQKWGNSAAVRLPVAVLEAAGLTLDQPVEIQVSDGTVVIKGVSQTSRYGIDELVAGITVENRHIDIAWESEPPIGREW